MRVETLTVKLLRSGRQYSNDTIELRVAVDDGEDWRELENTLRHDCNDAIQRHWREVEESERERRRAEREQSLNERSAKAAARLAEGLDPCIGCRHIDCDAGGQHECAGWPERRRRIDEAQAKREAELAEKRTARDAWAKGLIDAGSFNFCDDCEHQFEAGCEGCPAKPKGPEIPF